MDKPNVMKPEDPGVPKLKKPGIPPHFDKWPNW